MYKNLGKNKGITLVALVVTVIILLILAGISIASLTGNGLFEKAKLAKEKQKNAQVEEEARLSDYETIIAQYVSSSREVGEMTTEELKQFVEAIVETKMGTPTGSILAQMGNEAPSGYLFCDGSEYQIKDYQNLADYINRQFGSYNYFGGDGTTTFAVPNLQGEFLRGTGTNSYTNQGSGGAVGTHQNATNHAYSRSGVGAIVYPYNVSVNTNMDSYYSSGTMGIVNWSTKNYETQNRIFTSRPTNTSVLYCIKY